MRKLVYEQLENRALLATIAAFDLPPSSMEIVETSTRNFIDSTLMQIHPSVADTLQRPSLTHETAFENGLPVSITNLAWEIGTEVSQISTQRIVFTFTVHSNNSIGFHAALVPTREIVKSAFPIATGNAVKTEAYQPSLNNSVELRTENETLADVGAKPSMESDLPKAAEARQRSTQAHPIQDRSRRTLNSIAVDLVCERLCAEPAQFDIASIKRSDDVNESAVGETGTPSAPTRESLDLKAGYCPLSQSMSFLRESAEVSNSASRTTDGSSSSAIVQVLIGLSKSSPLPSVVDVRTLELGQGGAMESANPTASLEAFVVAIGLGFTLHSRKRVRSAQKDRPELLTQRS